MNRNVNSPHSIRGGNESSKIDGKSANDATDNGRKGDSGDLADGQDCKGGDGGKKSLGEGNGEESQGTNDTGKDGDVNEKKAMIEVSVNQAKE